MEYDEWLIDGAERETQSPETFKIPKENRRESVMVGTFVKIGLEDPDDGGLGERFWVEVIERKVWEGRLFYVGTVANDLTIFDIPFGAPLTFGPQHILQILL